MNPERVPLIAANWKMHLTATEARRFVIRLKPFVKDIRDREVVIFPAFTAIPAVIEELRDPNVFCGGQNLYWEEKGAYTGEVAASFLADLGCSFVLVGHSERRRLFGETDETCRKKLAAALGAHIIPIFCCGETQAERDSGSTFDVVGRQLGITLAGLAADAELVVAYEPVWAIGTGRNATPGQAQEVHAWIRRWLAEHVSPAFAEKTRVIYGGSVKPDNIDSLMREPDIDGVLVGGASLDIDSFSRIIQFQAPGR